MSFRRRITLVSAAAVAVAVVLASLLTYLLTSHQLRGQVDSQLSRRADSLTFIARNPRPPAKPDLVAGRRLPAARSREAQPRRAAGSWATCRRGPTRSAAISSWSIRAAMFSFVRPT
jgi:hypothetical protein